MINKQLKIPTEREHTQRSQDLEFTDINLLTTLPGEAGLGSGLSTWPAGGDSPHSPLSSQPSHGSCPWRLEIGSSLSGILKALPFSTFSSVTNLSWNKERLLALLLQLAALFPLLHPVFRLDGRAGEKSPRPPDPRSRQSVLGASPLLLGCSWPSALHHILDSGLSTQYLSGLARCF